MQTSDNKEKVKRRPLLAKQPARALMIDVSRSFESDVATIMCDALDNLFAVACTTAGPTRIPLASILILSTYPEILMPLSYIKGNMARIQGATSDLRMRLRENSVDNQDAGCVGKGVLDALRSYVSQLNTMAQPSNSFHQLEIIIISCHSTDHIIKQIEAVNSLIDIQHIKRIMVVSVNDGNNENYNSVNTSQTSSTSPTISTDPQPITGLIDAQILDNDPLGFHNLFYWWLTNDSSDNEHLHIVFSSPQGDIDEPLTIKCDLYERLLSPTQLPFIESYTLHPDSASCKSVFPSTSKATGMTVPIHKIKITNLLPTSSVCESLVFGMPMIVQATTCWKVDWDELDKNQNNFKALCHLLLTKDLVMLGKLQPETNSKQKGGKQQDCQLLPRGTFLILPAPNGTLLVKSIAVRELILPFRERQSDEEIPEKSLNIVQTCLSQIDMSRLYNPLLQDSGLFECLKYKPKPNNCSNRQHKRQSNKSWPSPVPVKVTPGEPITVTSGYSNQSDYNNILLSRKSTFLTHLE